MTFSVTKTFRGKSGSYEFIYRENESWYFFFVIILILFIGFRPLSGLYFGDMANYHGYYNKSLDGQEFVFDLDTANIIFDNLFAFWGSAELGTTSFFLLISAIYFGCTYWGIRRFFPTHKLAAYLVFLAAFSTFSYATNGIKAGAAAAIFILAYSYRDDLKICIPLMLVSWGFHHSMHLPLAAFFLTLIFKDVRSFFYVWLFCFLMALAHVGAFANLFAGMTDETGAGYLITTEETTIEQFGGKGGFRLDFILYSAAPVLVGYFAVFKKTLQISDTYRSLLSFYLCTNGIWMLCMYATFTNRIAYLSWFIYPIVLIYPFLHEEWGEDKYRLFRIIMIGHLCFTLFMYLK